MKDIEMNINNKTETLVFPYDFLLPSILSDSDISIFFDIKKVVSLPCYNCGDTQYVKNIKVEYDFFEAIKEIDSILWIESRLFKEKYGRDYILERIKCALLSKKIVYCFQKLDIETLLNLESFNSPFEKIFYNLNGSDCISHRLLQSYKFKKKPLLDLIIPIVNLPICEEISLVLRKNYQKRKIEFAQIFNNGLGYLCNEYIFPGFFTSSEYSINERINMFVGYVNQISEKENVDRILLTSPFPLFPINEYDITDHGIYLNMMTALTNDSITYIILDYDNISEEYLDYITNYLKFRYNRNNIKFIISAIHINNIDLRELPQYIGYDMLEDYPLIMNDLKKYKNSIIFMKEIL